MDENLKLALQKFIISYTKLYADELVFMAQIVENNIVAFDDHDSLAFYLRQLSHNMLHVMNEHFSKDLIEETDKAHFVVKMAEDGDTGKDS